MKATYLLRQCPWLNTDERRVARYIARHAHKALVATATTPPAPLAACAIHALATGHVLFQRAQQRLAEALAPTGDPASIAPLASSLVESQAAYLAAHLHLEQLASPCPDAADAPASPQPRTTSNVSPHPNSVEGHRASDKAARDASDAVRSEQEAAFAEWAATPEGRAACRPGALNYTPPQNPDSTRCQQARREAQEKARTQCRAQQTTAYEAQRAKGEKETRINPPSPLPAQG